MSMSLHIFILIVRADINLLTLLIVHSLQLFDSSEDDAFFLLKR